MKALDEGRAVHRRVILDVREVIQQWRIISPSYRTHRSISTLPWTLEGGLSVGRIVQGSELARSTSTLPESSTCVQPST